MMCSAPVVIVLLCFLCYVRLFCPMFYVFYIRHFVTERRNACHLIHFHILCVCVLTEVCLLVLWVMVVHWFKFLSLLAKALCNNNHHLH